LTLQSLSGAQTSVTPCFQELMTESFVVSADIQFLNYYANGTPP
jgi:hypothetical protein